MFSIFRETNSWRIVCHVRPFARPRLPTSAQLPLVPHFLVSPAALAIDVDQPWPRSLIDSAFGCAGAGSFISEIAAGVPAVRAVWNSIDLQFQQRESISRTCFPQEEQTLNAIPVTPPRDCSSEQNPAHSSLARAPVRHLYTNARGMLVNDGGFLVAARGVGAADARPGRRGWLERGGKGLGPARPNRLISRLHNPPPPRASVEQIC